MKDRIPGSSVTDEDSDYGERTRRFGALGDPACQRCGGAGWLRRDVPVGHPDFGRVYPCECIADRVAEHRLEAVRRASQIGDLQEMRFDTFEVDAPGNSPEARRSLQSALDAARAFAESPEGWLVLHGGYGTGKTHLAAAIVNERLRAGHTALFVVVPDLLDHLRSAFGAGAEDEGFDERFDAVRDAPLLVLDDLGTQAPTAWAAEKLYQLLNYRYNRRLPTVITTNCDLDDLDDRLRSRLGHVGVVHPYELKALDYRGGTHPERVELSTLHLYAAMTFQTWDARTGTLVADTAENLARAFHTAREFAEDPNGWLVLMGGHGCGKTHLAAAIANHRASSGGASLFVVVPDLLDHLRATYSPSSRVGYDARFAEVRTARLLVLDDLGTESATPWAREKLYQLLNHRYAARLPTVITTAAGLEDIDGRIRTRMLDRRLCTIFEILAGPYHGPTVEPPRTARRGGRRARR